MYCFFLFAFTRQLESPFTCHQIVSNGSLQATSLQSSTTATPNGRVQIGEDGGVPERKVHTQFPRWTNTSFPPFIALLPSWSRGFCTVIRPPCDSWVEELDLWVLWRHRDCGIPRCNASGWWWAEVLQIESPVFCVPLLHRW